MPYDLDVPGLLVQRRGDSGRYRLERIKHGRFSGCEEHEIADTDDDVASRLIRRYRTGELFSTKRVSNSLQLRDTIRGWRWRRRRRDDAAFQFDRIGGMQCKRHLGG